MTVEFLVSTMNRENLDFLKSMFSKITQSDFSVLVINQCNKITPPEISSKNKNIRCISTKETGISNSRNMAIKNATGDLCVICDDDTTFESDCVDILAKNALNSPDADLFTFKIITPEGSAYKSYPSASKFITSKIENLSISSIEIAFRRDAIIKNNILFYNWLGLGTDFSGGEEVCFIKDCILSKLKVWFINEFLVCHPFESSGKSYDKMSNALANGAIYAKMYPLSFSIWNLYFALKRYKYYKGKYPFLRYFSFMQKGSFKMIKTTNKK